MDIDTVPAFRMTFLRVASAASLSEFRSVCGSLPDSSLERRITAAPRMVSENEKVSSTRSRKKVVRTCRAFRSIVSFRIRA